jgi:hypothetical protein
MVVQMLRTGGGNAGMLAALRPETSKMILLGA